MNNDKHNIANRQKMAKDCNISEEKAAEMMTMMSGCYKTALKDLMERVTYQSNMMTLEMVSSGMPIEMAKTLANSMAMSAALSIIECITLKQSGEVSDLAKKIMDVVDSSSAITLKHGEDGL